MNDEDEESVAYTHGEIATNLALAMVIGVVIGMMLALLIVV